ncbi:hypothetical protein ACP4OV_005826 [Aristida adscensionis]
MAGHESFLSFAVTRVYTGAAVSSVCDSSINSTYCGAPRNKNQRCTTHQLSAINEASSQQDTMRPSNTLALATALVALLAAADATVETTCRAAGGGDPRVDYDFCVSELGKHRDSRGADDWGLAKVAANVGVNNAGGAVREIEALLAGPSGRDATARAALGQCRTLYFDMELAFAGAYDDINARDYAGGKVAAAEAISLARRCDDVFAEAGLTSPLAHRGEYSVKIAVVCTAITDLIK